MRTFDSVGKGLNLAHTYQHQTTKPPNQTQQIVIMTEAKGLFDWVGGLGMLVGDVGKGFKMILSEIRNDIYRKGEHQGLLDSNGD